MILCRLLLGLTLLLCSPVIALVWATPGDLSNVGQDAFEPQIIVDAAGNATVVWYRFNGSNSIIQAAIGNNFLGPVHVTGRQVLNRFATQSEYFNELHWMPSPTIPTKYSIYRDGVWVAEVPATQLSYRDHFRQKGEAIIYTIKAVNAIDQESIGTTVTVP